MNEFNNNKQINVVFAQNMYINMAGFIYIKNIKSIYHVISDGR